MKTIDRHYAVLNALPVFVVSAGLVAAFVRHGAEISATAPLAALCVLAIVGAALTAFLNPRN